LSLSRAALFLQALPSYLHTALEYYTPESALLHHPTAQYNLDLAHKALGNKEEARAAFQEAVKYFRQMGDVARAEMALGYLQDLEDAD
jgi:tetratricopeptide (TPR) repeat protein